MGLCFLYYPGTPEPKFMFVDSARRYLKAWLIKQQAHRLQLLFVTVLQLLSYIKYSFAQAATLLR